MLFYHGYCLLSIANLPALYQEGFLTEGCRGRVAPRPLALFHVTGLLSLPRVYWWRRLQDVACPVRASTGMHPGGGAPTKILVSAG